MKPLQEDTRGEVGVKGSKLTELAPVCRHSEGTGGGFQVYTCPDPPPVLYAVALSPWHVVSK